MWIRLIEVNIKHDKLDEARKIYNEEIVPTIKTQKGNIDTFFMESKDRECVVISFTSWETQEKGDAYEKTGTYVKMVNKIKHTFAGMPTLWSYEVKK